jgi:hypothetical protein
MPSGGLSGGEFAMVVFQKGKWQSKWWIYLIADWSKWQVALW